MSTVQYSNFINNNMVDQTRKPAQRMPSVGASVFFMVFFLAHNVQAWSSSANFPASRHTACSVTSLSAMSPDLSTEEALARTKAHLEKLKQRQSPPSDTSDLHLQQQESIAQETFYRKYIMQSANSLKQELKDRKLPTKGRKPDLARRLAAHDLSLTGKGTPKDDNNNIEVSGAPLTEDSVSGDVDISDFKCPVSFAGLTLSETAALALHQAGFLSKPSPIQVAAIPAQTNGESVLLHAPTGSGKTLAYLLPITEELWAEPPDAGAKSVSLIVTPTRELAAQVAGVATTLAPAGTVRLISHPSNLMSDGSKERSDRASGQPRIIVGSAKAIVTSLYGNEQYPASPTPKPLALHFLKSTRVLVMDEVDRLLAVQGKYNDVKKKEHEKPAAILAAAVARHSLGRAQIVAASATVGRPLKRELARVLGLPPPKGPRVIVAKETIAEGRAATSAAENESKQLFKQKESEGLPRTTRVVTIPDTVEHYLSAVEPKDNEDSTSSGQLLIRAYQVIQDVVSANPNARMLLVLTRGFGISNQQVIGALRHFKCKPDPRSLLDALQEDVQGTDQLMQVHREVSGATGVGQSLSEETANDPSLWVTGEDTIRGLHLDGLDVVIVVGRPRGVDEYTHIAGRTGRAGECFLLLDRRHQSI